MSTTATAPAALDAAAERDNRERPDIPPEFRPSTHMSLVPAYNRQAMEMFINLENSPLYHGPRRFTAQTADELAEEDRKEERRRRFMTELTRQFLEEFAAYEQSYAKYQETYDKVTGNIRTMQRDAERQRAELAERQKALEERNRELHHAKLADGTEADRDANGVWRKKNGQALTADQQREAEEQYRQNLPEVERIERELQEIKEKQKAVNEFLAQCEQRLNEARLNKDKIEALDQADRELERKIRSGEISDPAEIQRARDKLREDRQKVEQETRQLEQYGNALSVSHDALQEANPDSPIGPLSGATNITHPDEAVQVNKAADIMERVEQTQELAQLNTGTSDSMDDFAAMMTGDAPAQAPSQAARTTSYSRTLDGEAGQKASMLESHFTASAQGVPVGETVQTAEYAPPVQRQQNNPSISNA